METEPVWDAKLGIWNNSNVPWSSTAQKIPRPLWLFGYGSICWKPSFPFAEKCDGFIRGYIRRFWQSSTDHRGTPQSPGVVMTLIDKADVERLETANSMKTNRFQTDDKVQGVAYRIPDDEVESVVKDLDFREKGGYSRMVSQIHLDRGDGSVEVVDGLVYVARTDNPHFRFYSMQQSAQIIATSVGPSGTNRDYLYQLNRYFVDNGIDDEYVRMLTRCVKAIRSKSKL